MSTEFGINGLFSPLLLDLSVQRYFCLRPGLAVAEASMADANPLNKSLPAEVVFRRKPQAQRAVRPATDVIEVDLKAALANKPEARIRWLEKACELAYGGRASSRDLFDIISNRKFTAGLSHRIGSRILAIANDHSTLFSDRQQRYMQSEEWILNAKYGADENEARDEEDRRDGDTSRRTRDTLKDSEEEADESPKNRRRSAEDQIQYRKAREEEELERREALNARLAAGEQERREKRERSKRSAVEIEEGGDFTAKFLDKQPEKKQQLEEQADMVDDMLARLSNRGQRPAEEAEAPPRRHRRRRAERSRSMSVQAPVELRPNRGSARGGVSRSRSVSVQGRRTYSPNDRRRGTKESFQDALARRMAQRERESDSTRIPVTWTRDDMRRGRHLATRS